MRGISGPNHPQRVRIAQGKERMIRALATGCSLTAAADRVGVPRRTILDWRRNDDVFANAVAAAMSGDWHKYGC